MQRKASSDHVRDDKVYLLKNGVVVGSNYATSGDWGTSDSTQTYGGSTNKWGTTWTASDINNINMGVAFSARQNGGQSARTASVDFIRITVYYTVSVQPDPNPALGQSCGLDVALVLDSSGSIDSQTELPQMKSAFKDFVDVFLPNTPTEFSVSEFDTTTILPTLNFTNSIDSIKNRIDAAQSGGSTNWEAGLSAAQGTFGSGRANVPNLVIFSSDGNPNKYGNNQGSGNGFDPAALDAAITVANTIKNSGTRIITLGIGNTTGQDALNPDNLKAISSSDAYYGVADFASLAQTLQQLATDLCGGTITIHKLIDQDRDLQTTDDQRGGADWQFTVADTPQTTDSNGYTQPLPILNGTYSVTEDLKSGYNLMAASCSGAINNGTLSGNTISGIQVGTDNIVSCTFL